MPRKCQNSAINALEGDGLHMAPVAAFRAHYLTTGSLCIHFLSPVQIHSNEQSLIPCGLAVLRDLIFARVSDY
jgi:hypothetical protein